MSEPEPSSAALKSRLYANARFAADLPALTIDETAQVEAHLARSPGEPFWTPLARRALMESFVRSRIDPADIQSLMDAVQRGDVAPILPVDNRTPYFPAARPWVRSATSVVRERVTLTFRVLGTRALILAERRALHVGDFADAMKTGGITDYFHGIGTPTIDGALAGFVLGLAPDDLGPLTRQIIEREYGAFQPIRVAEAEEFRGGPAAVDRPGLADLMQARRAAHAEFDTEYRRLGVNLHDRLEKSLRQLYPWDAAGRSHSLG